MRPEFLTFGRPLVGQEEESEIVATLRSGWLGTGPKTKAFEAEFAAFVGARHAVGVNSGTAALHLALETLGIGPRHEVIVPAMTFCASANVVEHVGARPVLVDVREDTGTIDTAAAAEAITRRTRAIMPVDLYGHPADLDELCSLARRHGLFIVEDAAHATEARYRGRPIGSIASLTAFSFYVTKNVVTGEGGMVVTDNDDWADDLRIRSLHGISRDAWKRYSAAGYQHYETILPGHKYNMFDLQASLGIHQLRRVERNLVVRERHWRRYEAAFSDIPELRLTPLVGDVRHARHLFTIRVQPSLGLSRDEMIQALHAENVGVGVHFTALSQHRFYRTKYGYCPGAFPRAEAIGSSTLSLPLSAALNDSDVDDVCEAVRRIVLWARQRQSRAG